MCFESSRALGIRLSSSHADPRSARHGHRRWEIDNTWLTVRLLAWLGLATDVVVPNAHLAWRPPGTRLTTRGTTGVPVE